MGTERARDRDVNARGGRNARQVLQLLGLRPVWPFLTADGSDNGDCGRKEVTSKPTDRILVELGTLLSSSRVQESDNYA